MQKIITYEKEKGGERINYTTAYTGEQAMEAVTACVERHGKDKSVRIVNIGDPA